jgi:4-amino-4-deoxychorismate lyase
MILINGANDHCIPITDRGFQYGDGLFETIEIQDGQAVFWRRHLRRLENGCRQLRIPCPEAKLLAGEAQSLCRHAARAVLKIIVTRGSGGRGYRQADTIETTRVLSLHPFPDYPASLRQDGIVARFCATRLGLNPALAGLKHLNRLEQVLARAEWQDQDIHEGLMLNMNGQVVEGTMSNLFLVKNAVLHTAPLHFCGIAGIVREVVLEACAQHGLPVAQTPLTKADVLAADELFVTNSVIGIWPVRAVETGRFETNGPVLRQVSAWLAAYKLRERCDAA